MGGVRGPARRGIPISHRRLADRATTDLRIRTGRLHDILPDRGIEQWACLLSCEELAHRTSPRVITFFRSL